MFGSDKFTSLSMRTSKIAEEADDKSPNKKEKESVNKKASKETPLVSRLLDGDRSAKDDLMQDAMDSLGQMKKSNEAIKKQMNQELDQIFGKKESGEDMVQLSMENMNDEIMDELSGKKVTKKKEQQINQEKEEMAQSQKSDKNQVSKNMNLQYKTLEQMKKANQQKQINSDLGKSQYQEECNKSLKEYSTTLTEYLISKSPQQKEKMEQIKKNLQENGVSSGNVLKMEQRVSNMVRQHLTSELRDKMLKYLFSKGETVNKQSLKSKELLSFFESAIKGNEALGGENFGNYKEGADTLFSKTMHHLKEELSGFLLDTTQETFVTNTINQKGEAFKEELGKLQKFCSAAGIVINNAALIKRIQTSVSNLGLEHFIPPQNKNQTFDFSEGDERGREKESEDKTIYLSQEDQFIEKLRMLYFQKALNPGFRATFELSFKIKKMKNNLLKLGIFDKELDQRLSEEGCFLAKEKLLEDLHKVFLEQATLQKLEGPAYDILRNRKAFIIKSLHKIGYKIKDTEINRIRDEANREMFPVIKEQFIKLEMMADAKESIWASRQRKVFIAILTRLKEETAISDTIEANMDSGKGFTERTIVEAA